MVRSVPPQLNPLVMEDLQYLYELARQTMREYVEADRQLWDHDAVMGTLSTLLEKGAFYEVSIRGRRVGAVAIERHETHIELEQLYIEQRHQNQGIGTRIVEGLTEEGERLGVPVRLHVFLSNPARALYERLGFRLIGQVDDQYHLEYAV